MIRYALIRKKDIDDKQFNYITNIFNKLEEAYSPLDPYLVLNINKLTYFTLIASASNEMAINLNKKQFDRLFKLLIIDRELAINYINTLRGS